VRRHQEAARGEEVEREKVVSSIKGRLAGRWRPVSYQAQPEEGEALPPLGPAPVGGLAGASNLRHIALEGARLVLSGSMSLDGRPHSIRVVWERPAE
jgi:hypothetical protein